jgi:hypothetical protein
MTTANILSQLGSAGVSTGFKNKLINGGMQVWQRGTSSATVNAYTTVDRWYMSGGTVTMSQGAINSPNNNYSLVATAGTNGYINPSQAIEALNVYQLRGQTVTFSFYVKLNSGSFSGGYQGLLYYSNSSDAINVSTGSVSAIASSGVITPTSVWQKVYATFTIPSDAVGLTFMMNITALQASGTVWALADAQVEVGTTATNFDYRPYGTELSLCQRYYWLYQNGGLGSTAGTSIVGNGVVRMPVTMRTQPTLSASATFTPQVGNAGTVAVYTGTGAGNGSDGLFIYNSAANWTVGAAMQLSNAGFSAEL